MRLIAAGIILSQREWRTIYMKKRTLMYLLLICCLLSITTTVMADPVCTAEDYCSSIISVKEQTSPVYFTGDFTWLISADTLFPVEVKFTDGTEEMNDPSPRISYACSIDGTAFVGCNSEVFSQVGSYKLRVTAIQNDQLFYNESNTDTLLTIIDSEGTEAQESQSEGFQVIYHDILSDSGSVPVDQKLYQDGEEGIILGNLGLNAETQPDPLVRSGFLFDSWNTSADLDGDSYAFGQLIPIQGNLDLYPQWMSMETPDESKTLDLSPEFFAASEQPVVDASLTLETEDQTLVAKQWPGEPPFGGIATPPNFASPANIEWYRVPNCREGEQCYPPRQEWPRDPDQPDRFPKPQLPRTGFSTKNMTLLREQPASLAYDTLGISIDVPVLDVTANLVIVPEDEDNWAVDWLGDQAGLLQGSALPGEGTSFIAAHNHLNNLEAGPFLFLMDLEENDRIFVRDASGDLIEYGVFANELFEPDEFAAVQNKAAEVENALVLITCENESADGGYLNRRVVFAKPL